MKLFVIIPNWNGADFLEKCLESVKNQSQKCEVIVVDNNSSDDSVKIMEDKFPDIIIIKNSSNLGFAGGVNTGIKFAIDQKADFIALFNNDATADKHWLQALVDELESNKDVGISTGKLLRDDGKHFDSTGDFYSIYGISFPRGRNQIDNSQFDQKEAVFGASGGASLYRAEMLRKIGVFDERFFAYYEDVDISFRAQLAGWKIRYTPKAVAYHRVGATSSKLGDFSRYHSIKNFLLLYTKNMPGLLYWKYLPLFVYQFMRTVARSILDRKVHVLLRAVFAFIKYLPGVVRDRHQIQSKRKVSVDYIDSILYKKKPEIAPEVIKNS